MPMLKACNIIAEVSRRKQSVRLCSRGLYHYVSSVQPTTAQRNRVSVPLRVLFAVSLMWGVPTLACGSFAPRPTPTPSPQPAVTIEDLAAPPPIVSTPTQNITIIEPTATVAPSPTSAPPPPVAPQGLTPGGRALVTAPAGLNMRIQPTSDSQLLIRLTTGKSVNVVEGPTQAENFTWWRVDDGEGHVGWVAERDAETQWLTPDGGAVASAPATGVGGVNPNARPVDRAPRVGDRVEVTMQSGAQLTLRTNPDRDSAIVTRVNIGQRFSIESGPQASDGYDWYLIRSDDNAIRGWAAAGDGRIRWLSPLE